MGKQDKEQAGVMDRLRKLMENGKYRKILIAVGIGAILLIFLSSYFPKGDKAAEPEAPAETAASLTAEEYTRELEASLTQIIEGIEGAGATKVMVTTEKGVEQVYATEQKKSTQTTQDNLSGEGEKNQAKDDVETNYIIVEDADGAQKALAVTQVQPVVKGVVIVCEGGDNPSVQQRVTDAVTTALNLSSARVCVVKSQS